MSPPARVGYIEICQRGGAREVRVNVHDFCASLFRLHDVGKRDRVGFSHIAAHNQDAVAIDEVLRKGCGTAAAQ